MYDELRKTIIRSPTNGNIADSSMVFTSEPEHVNMMNLKIFILTE